MDNIFKYLFILILCSALPLFGQNPDIDSLLELGNKKIGEKNYNKALAEFEKVLRIDKTNEKAVTGKLNSLLYLEKINEAENYINTQIALNEHEAIFYYGKGILLIYNKQFKKAVENFDMAIELDTGEKLKNIYISRGIAYENMKLYDEAIDDLSTYLRYDKSNTNALYHRGFNYYLLENYKNAIDDFNAVIAIDKNHGYAYYNLGMSYYKNEDILNACKNFQLACQLNNINACKMILTGCSKK